MLISLCGYLISNAMLNDAVVHYRDTCKINSNVYYDGSMSMYTNLGCGKYSCHYCQGVETSGFYFDAPNFHKIYSESFRYYQNVFNVKCLFETCANIFLIATIVFACIAAFTIVISKKKKTPQVNLMAGIRENYETTQDNQIYFCKYCGEKIDLDSIFCSHCGKKLREK